VSHDGNTAVIGAYGDDDDGTSTVAVLLYSCVQLLVNGCSKQSFYQVMDLLMTILVSSVTVTEERAVIGAYWDDDNGPKSGSPYVFIHTATGAWTQQVKLVANDGTTEDRFGQSVAVSGVTAVIGTHLNDENGLNKQWQCLFV